MAGVKVNYRSLSKKVETALSPTLRRGLAMVATKTAHWGIKDHGDLAMIMGVLNFGDPDHRVPNTPEGKEAPIPKRPWLSQTTEGQYRYFVRRYVEINLLKVVSGLSKRGKVSSVSSQRSLSVEDFLQGLSELGAENARDNWENGNFAPNTPATLHNKRGDKPLHDKGRMSREAITGWVS